MAGDKARREVELALSITTANADSLRQLRDSVKALAKEGGEAAPEFERLAGEIDALAKQATQLQALELLAGDLNQAKAAQQGFAEASERLRKELEQLSTATKEARAHQDSIQQALSSSRRQAQAAGEEIGQLRKQYREGSISFLDYKRDLDAATKQQQEARARVRELGEELDRAKTATKAAGEAQAELSKQYRAANSETQSSVRQVQALQAEAGNLTRRLIEAGAATGDVAQAQANVQDAMRRSQQAVRALAEEQDNAAAAAARRADIEEQAAVEAKAAAASYVNWWQEALREREAAEKRAADAARAALREREAEEKRLQAIVERTHAEMREAAKAEADGIIRDSQRMEQAARDAAAGMANAFRTLGLRSLTDIESEIRDVSQALALLSRNAQVSGADFDRAFAAGNQRIQSLHREMITATGEVKETSLAARAAAASVDSLRGAFLQLGAMYGTFELAQKFFDANVQIEALRRSLTLISGSTTVAAQQIQFLQGVAETAGQSVGNISESFIRFSAAASTAGVDLQTVNDVFRAVTVAGGQLGLSSDKVSHALDALGQIASKGTVSLEELRGQLGDSLPGALAIAANGLGVTQDRLIKMVESGQLKAIPFFKAFKQGMADAFGDGTKQVEGLLASWNRLKNAFTELAQRAQGGTFLNDLQGALDFVAKNLAAILDTVVGLTKATAAYIALNFAKNLLGLGTAAKAATTELAALAAAQRSTGATAAAAGAQAAAGAAGFSRLAGVISGIKTFTLVGVLTNAKEIGSAIGETTARWAGWGKALDANEKKLREQDAATRAAFEAHQQLAAGMEAAEKKALGLSEASSKLVDEFGKIAEKAANSEEFVRKFAKELNVIDISGLRVVGEAMSALAATSRVTGNEIREILEHTLKGVDLSVFVTTARAAFADVRDGADRLGEAIDAAMRESARRAGLSFDELQDKVGHAAREAISDVGVLIDNLDRLKAQGIDVGRVLTASFHRAIQNADSERALEQIRVRLEDVRKVLGAKVVDGLLDDARQKTLDLKDALELARPGIDSLREAYRQLGVAAPEELARIAQKNKEAWDTVARDGAFGSEQTRKAFERYAQSALENSGAVGTAQRRVTEEMLRSEAAARGLKVAFDETGQMVVKSALAGEGALKQLRAEAEALNAELKANAAAIEEINNRSRVGNDRITSTDSSTTIDAFKKNADGSASGTFTNGLPVDLADRLKRTGGAGMSADEIATAITQAENAYRDMQAFVRQNPGAASFDYQQSTQALMVAAQIAKQRQNAGSIGQASNRTVTVNIGGKNTVIGVDSQASSDAVVSLLRQIETAAGSAA